MRLAPELIDQLRERSYDCIVTSNQRLARVVREALSDLHEADGHQAWLMPAILPFGAWLQEEFRTLSSAPDQAISDRWLLSAHQASAVFSDVVATALQRRATPFIAQSGLVDEVLNAFRLMQRFQVSDETLGAAASDDDSQFLAECVAAYREQQRREGWLIDDELPQWLMQQDGWARSGSPDACLFAGFSQMTPAQEALLAHLGETRAFWQAPKIAAGVKISRVVCDNDDEECIAAGQWARRQLQANPRAQLAIVVAGFSTRVERVRRLVAEGLTPAAQCQLPADAADQVLAVSLGRALDDYPAAALLLALTELTVEPVGFVALSRLLRSPLLRQDTAVCNEIDRRLRGFPDRQWRTGRLLQWLEQQALAAPDWLLAANALAQRTHQQSATPRYWAEAFHELLEQAGWLHEFELDSALFQLRNAVFEALNTLADQTRVLPDCSATVARDALCRILKQTIHQSEDQRPSVLIAGPLELVSLKFDAVRLIGLDAAQWPPRGQPSSLLPRELQRRFSMPDASPQQLLEFWRLQLDLLLGSSAEVTLSYPRMRDETELLPTRMIEPWQDELSLPVTPPTLGVASLLGSLRLLRTEETISALHPSRREVGGHAVLKWQADDPISALAQFRWGCRPLQEPETGIDALTRGNLLHEALEALYRDWPDQASIAGLSEPARRECIRAATARVFARQFASADAMLATLLRIEERRACELIEQLVSNDLERPAFSLLAVEQATQLTVGGLTIRLRIDRIDQVDGQLFVIDYKTGDVRNGCPPENLPDKHVQLVAYALALKAQRPLGGLALLPVSYRGQQALLWCDEAAELMPAARAQRIGDLPSLLEQWQARCDRLGQAFVAGDFRMNPDIPLADRYPLLVVTRASEEYANVE